ncbi:ESX secretion-associated protein EspG [Nocardia sp. NPDC051787]|uniref:ESX secretion-associated protein EspG n=1 Tax=Nocardia sp. NPDC051787 TaxID=3155415 RepID=UPI00342EE36D
MPDVQSWRFSALEFRILWESTGRDVLPYPLRHQYTTEFQSESLRLRRAAAQSLRPRIDDNLLRAVEVLLAPEARVELAAFAGARRDRRLRAHAGVRVTFGTDTLTVKPTTNERIATTLQQMINRTVTEVRDRVHLPY